MDKENFIFRPNLDPLKSVPINEVLIDPITGNRFVSAIEMLEKEKKLAEDREKLIEQFMKYKERNKAE